MNNRCRAERRIYSGLLIRGKKEQCNLERKLSELKLSIASLDVKLTDMRRREQALKRSSEKRFFSFAHITRRTAVSEFKFSAACCTCAEMLGQKSDALMIGLNAIQKSRLLEAQQLIRLRKWTDLCRNRLSKMERTAFLARQGLDEIQLEERLHLGSSTHA